MSDECKLIEDYIIQYANKTIEEQDKIKLINHLKYCPKCRADLAFTMKLSELVCSQMKDVQQEVLDNIFTKIPETEDREGIMIISQIKAELEPLKIVAQILSTAKKSVDLAFQFI